jgi:hypothetical protein
MFYTKLDAAEINLNLQLRLLTPTPVFSFPEFSRKHLPEWSLPDDESFDITSVRDPGADPRESFKHLLIITTLTKQFFFLNNSFPVPYTFVETFEASRTKKKKICHLKSTGSPVVSKSYIFNKSVHNHF